MPYITSGGVRTDVFGAAWDNSSRKLYAIDMAGTTASLNTVRAGLWANNVRVGLSVAGSQLTGDPDHGLKFLTQPIPYTSYSHYMGLSKNPHLFIWHTQSGDLDMMLTRADEWIADWLQNNTDIPVPHGSNWGTVIREELLTAFLDGVRRPHGPTFVSEIQLYGSIVAGFIMRPDANWPELIKDLVKRERLTVPTLNKADNDTSDDTSDEADDKDAADTTPELEHHVVGHLFSNPEGAVEYATNFAIDIIMAETNYRPGKEYITNLQSWTDQQRASILRGPDLTTNWTLEYADAISDIYYELRQSLHYRLRQCTDPEISKYGIVSDVFVDANAIYAACEHILDHIAPDRTQPVMTESEPEPEPTMPYPNTTVLEEELANIAAEVLLPFEDSQSYANWLRNIFQKAREEIDILTVGAAPIADPAYKYLPDYQAACQDYHNAGQAYQQRAYASNNPDIKMRGYIHDAHGCAAAFCEACDWIIQTFNVREAQPTEPASALAPEPEPEPEPEPTPAPIDRSLPFAATTTAPWQILANALWRHLNAKHTDDEIRTWIPQAAADYAADAYMKPDSPFMAMSNMARDVAKEIPEISFWHAFFPLVEYAKAIDALHAHLTKGTPA